MSQRVVVMCNVIAFYLCFQVREISFISNDCFDFILNVSNTGVLNENFIHSST